MGALSDTMVRWNTVKAQCSSSLTHLVTLGSLQKLVVIGGTVETARRVASSSWNSFIDCK
jgi:hypothetical protein